MKKFKLEINYDYDFELIGIVSTLPQYKLIWSINKALNIDLIKDNDLIIELKTKNLTLSQFTFREEYSYIKVLKNKSWESENQTNVPMALFDMNANEYLVPDLKQYDYIVQMSGKINNHYPEDVIEKMNSIKGIQYGSTIAHEDTKHLDNFLS